MANRSQAQASDATREANPRRELRGDALVPGHAQGQTIVLGEPLSFWGGYDSAAGRIIDGTHPRLGESLAGKIMVMAHAKGSSSSSSVLAEAIRNGTGPIGIVLGERDLIVSIGAIVAAELYGIAVPVVCLEPFAFDEVASAAGAIRIEADGESGMARIRFANP